MAEIQNTVQTNIQGSLQPQSIKKTENAYKSVLDIEERLRKGDATNIALTGPYGSGKSSILKSLEEDYPEYQYLNISLATLQSLKEDINEDASDTPPEDDEITKQNLDRLIEYSILQQLIYREKQETLPNSRLKRIFHLSVKKVGCISFSILVALIAIVIVFEPSFLRVEWLCQLLDHQWLNITGDCICLGYLVWFTFAALKMTIVALSNSRLNKLNLKSGEIEIVKNTSIFNKHLDEILYFFEMTDYNVVILEDLDRFESTAIFLKLRELNLLLNESKVIGRKIFFIYAVRDDMFLDEERVKCFDYITTVIPVINPSNAKSALKEELKKREVTEINERVLRDLGFFLRDMRLLKNIANEYVQYRARLAPGISGEKLLGMIVYKNHYPHDFAKLHDCDGMLYKLLNLKEKFVEKKVNEIEEENTRRQGLLTAYKKDRHLREEELRRIYVDGYRDRLSAYAHDIKAGDSFYSFSEVAKNENLFDKLIEDSNVEYHYISTGNYYVGQSRHNNASIPFTEVEKAINPQVTYKERLSAIRSSFDDLMLDKAVEVKKEDIRSQSLCQIMKGVDYASIPDYKELKIPRLMEFLVVNGYIDENYYDYISYFYDNFVDKHDWDFVLDLKLGKTHPYDFSIHQVEACLHEIPNTAYRSIAIMNIDIVDYLAEHIQNRKCASRLQVLLRTVVEKKKLGFLSEYYIKGKQQDVVFLTLFAQQKDLWNDFESHDDVKNSLKLIWYKYAEKELSCEESRDWLSKHYTFITEHMLDIEENEWGGLIRKNTYVFEELNEISIDLLKVVAERDAYILSKKNVEILVSCLLDMSCDSVSYELIRQTEHEQLIQRVEGGLDYCMKSVFSEPENEMETETTIVGILSSENVTEADKIAYLRKQKNKIDLERLTLVELKPLAMKCDVVVPSWENVIEYMNAVSETKADIVVVAFIERHANEFAALPVPRDPQEDAEMLLHQYIESDVLTFETYKKLLAQFKRWYYEDGVPSVEEGRIELMIASGMVHYSKANTVSLMENYSDKLVLAYLLKNKHAFLNDAGSVDYSTDVALGLFKVGSLSKTETATIIHHFKKEILNEALADEVVAVLNEQEIKLDQQFLLRVMELSKKTDAKISVLNYTLEKNDFDEDTITDFIKTLSDPYNNIAEKGKKPEVPKNANTLRLVSILKKKDYISSFSEKESGIRVNTKLK